MTNRRERLKRIGAGFGAMSLNALLASPKGGSGMLEPKAPHYPAKAKHVIFLFLNGGPSQVDTFDPKPMLTKYHGTLAPSGNLKTERKTGTLLKSPFEFKRFGKSGLEISEIFSNLGEHADDLCVIRSMHVERPNHEPSLLMFNTGHMFAGRPSMGSWLTYGLGTENQNLPGYVAATGAYARSEQAAHAEAGCGSAVRGPDLDDGSGVPDAGRGDGCVRPVEGGGGDSREVWEGGFRARLSDRQEACRARGADGAGLLR
jgi:hypothetical protein